MNGISVSVMSFMEEKLTLAVPVVAGFRMRSFNIPHAKAFRKLAQLWSTTSQAFWSTDPSITRAA